MAKRHPLNLNKPAEVADIAARTLARGGRPFSNKDFQKEVTRLTGDYRWGSLLPSDFSYNLINRARYSRRYPLLRRESRGKYTYLGPNYPYTGTILWKGEEVGSCEDGACSCSFRFKSDPVFYLKTDPLDLALSA